MAIELRPYRPEDAAALLDLRNRVFETDHGVPYLEWKAASNPAGPMHSWLAWENGALIGQYAALPMHLKIGNGYQTGYQVVDSMVAPEARAGLSKGRLFGRLAIASFQDYQRIHLPVAYGFPNHLARAYGREILHYEDIGALTKLVKPLQLASAAGELPGGKMTRVSLSLLFEVYSASLRVKNRWKVRTQKDSVFRTSRFPAETDAVAAEYLSRYPLAVARTSAYLNWRYSNHPVFRYQIYEARDERAKPRCWLVGRTLRTDRGTEGCLMDWIADPSDGDVARRLASLVVAAEEDFRADGAARIVTYYLGDPWMSNLLQRLGYLVRSNAKEIFLVGRTWSDSVSLSMLKNPVNWYATIGDCDGW